MTDLRVEMRKIMESLEATTEETSVNHEVVKEAIDVLENAGLFFPEDYRLTESDEDVEDKIRSLAEALDTAAFILRKSVGEAV